MNASEIVLGRVVYIQPGNVPVKILAEQIIDETVLVELPGHLLRMPRPGEEEDTGQREIPLEQLTTSKVLKMSGNMLTLPINPATGEVECD